MGALRIMSCCFALCMLLLAMIFQFLRSPVPEFIVRIYDEPAGLKEDLRSLPEFRKLNDEERAALKRDGVILLRNVIAEKDMAVLRKMMSMVNTSEGNGWDALAWTTHAGVKSMIWNGPFAALGADALEVPSVRIRNSDVWFKRAPGNEAIKNTWHTDDNDFRRKRHRVMTVWLMATPGPESIEFMLGSQKFNETGCPYIVPDVHFFHTDSVDQECITNQYAAQVAASRGQTREEVLVTYSLNPGDALVFDGQTWHRGIARPEDRLAFGMRFMPDGSIYQGTFMRESGHSSHRSWTPQECTLMGPPMFPRVFPKSDTPEPGEIWPLRPVFYDWWQGRSELDVIRMYFRGHAECDQLHPRAPEPELHEIFRYPALFWKMYFFMALEELKTGQFWRGYQDVHR
eukprot:gnl/TRDRNA2_/TRDRNA2_126381_c0_seq1.p1 gnl/TRDRNA2_/TRDRNA2_126381_c0~~gnl/TRDRNA2_/TRDRNA2_126381_c0_seq1.p1  ORF type:complete len:401 (-),score=45.64 gnl/TRDRNA2_/TRDRNA2_126381_c0_seq1:78-1280(-)